MKHSQYNLPATACLSAFTLINGCSSSSNPSTADFMKHPPVCQNLIQNQSFEAPVGDGSMDSLNVSLLKWTPEYKYSLIQHPGIPGGPGPRIQTNGNITGTQFFTTPAGSQFMFFLYAKSDATATNPAYDGATGLSQMIAIRPDGTQEKLDAGWYHLGFSQSALHDAGGGAWGSVDCHVKVEVSLNATPNSPIYAATFTVPHNQSWQPQAAMIHIQHRDKYTLRFLAAGATQTDVSVIDNVMFCKSTHPPIHP